MQNRWYYNNYAFRLASPILIGLVVYLLVLLFFDSVGELRTNFFSNELVFVIFLTLIFLETNRLVIVVLNKVYPFKDKFKLRILLQFLISIMASVVVISLVLYFYFVQFEGFSTISTELITFNLIYLLTSILFNLYYFSILLLQTRNNARFDEESKKKINIELEMETFKNHVNPDFLFQSLEIILSELHRDKKQADEQINNLAQIYRFTLDNKDAELIPLNKEVSSLLPVMRIFKAKYKDALEFTSQMDNNTEKYIIPGTLQIFFENAISRNINTTSIPLKFTLETLDSNLVLSYSLNRKLRSDVGSENRINYLKRAYRYFSDQEISIIENKESMQISIPLLIMEEE